MQQQLSFCLGVMNTGVSAYSAIVILSSIRSSATRGNPFVQSLLTFTHNPPRQTHAHIEQTHLTGSSLPSTSLVIQYLEVNTGSLHSQALE